MLALALSAAALLLSWAAYVVVSAYRLERAAFLPNRHPPRLSLAEFGVPGARAVRFPSRTGDLLAGYYAPSSNGAAIVLCHGSQGERSDMADEARILASAGFGVLAMDWPGHGESAGAQIVWGQPERRALEGALDFLEKQPGVQPSKLGAFGFSMGGYIVTQVASYDARLRAVVIAGAPHDPTEHTRWEYRKVGLLRQPAALAAIRASGMRLDELVPERVIGQIAPRAVLLVRGTADDHVPRWITERLWRAAREPKQRLEIAGAGHGGYAQADPERYGKALLDFFAALSAAAAK